MSLEDGPLRAWTLLDGTKWLQSRKIPPITRVMVLARAEDRCELRWDDRCTGDAATLHHVLPRELGGENSTANLLGACASCHLEVHRLANVVPAHRRGLLRGALTIGELSRLGVVPGEVGRMTV